MRVDFVNFMFEIMPHEKRNKGSSYKNTFFQNDMLKEHFMHALIVVYGDSEKTGYYSKFGIRHYAASLLEYIWKD